MLKHLHFLCLALVVAVTAADKNWDIAAHVIDLANKVECERNEHGDCKQGTVKVDSWLDSALRLQTRLQRDLPLTKVVLPSTHNSAIATPYGIGKYEKQLDKFARVFGSRVIIANQRFSLTDQLNMGVRQLELDTHWFLDDLRLCHAGGFKVDALDKVIDLANRWLHAGIEWDSQTLGCWANNIDPETGHMKTLLTGLEEIHQFLSKKENQEEVAVLFLDDQADLTKWGKVNYLEECFTNTFGDMLLTPQQKEKLFGKKSGWPSISELLKHNKRVVVATRTHYDSNIIFNRWWTEYDVTDLHKFPNCAPLSKGGDDFARLVDGDLVYGPFDDETKKGTVAEKKLRQITTCALTWASIDQMSPLLLENAVWTWDKHQPKKPSEGNAFAVVQKDNGRWRVAEASFQARFACQDESNLDSFVVSECASSFDTPCCPDGTTFSPPLNGYHNELIRVAAAGDEVWLAVDVE